MFRTRVLTASILLPVVILLAILGGWGFFALIVAILTLAVVEFCGLMRKGGYQPPPVFAVALLWVFLLDAQLAQMGITTALLGPGVSLVLMGSMAWQLAHREGNPVANWALGLAGALYVGWLGAYMIRLRGLPEGVYWVLTALPAIWIADSGAYSIGRAWGRNKLAPAISPGKTWEGYVGGILVGALATAGLAALWSLLAGPSGPRWIDGLVLGVLVGALAPLGDLIVSMVKRQVGAKDTGTIFPGHGGALDRVDSVLWAAVIGYYFVSWFHGV